MGDPAGIASIESVLSSGLTGLFGIAVGKSMNGG
jgi:hypothetical protein